MIWNDTPKGAWISDCGKYRYALWRCWSFADRPLIFVMCNPSTADADVDDPTIRKCVGFARKLGFGGISVVNLYASRATDPKLLKSLVLEEGSGFDSLTIASTANTLAVQEALRIAAQTGTAVVAAWGGAARDNGPLYEHRVRWLRAMASDQGVVLSALKVALDGKTPCHPLMLPYSCELQPWNP